MEMKMELTFDGDTAGMPYLRAEMQSGGLEEKLRAALEEEKGAFVWLTDEPEAVKRLKGEGKCVLYLLTRENAGAFCAEADWCAEGETDTKFLWQVWLRSRGLPWHICETPRLCLRETLEEDLDFFYEMTKEEETAGFLEPLEENRATEREKLAAYRQQMYGFYGFGIWTLLEKDTGRTVGRAGLQMREGYPEPELGFGIAAGFRRQGYGEEACRAVLDYAEKELELKQVRAVVDERNVKSRRLCEKLGFYVDTIQKTASGMWIYYRYDCKNVVV